jgi:peptide-methionine (R)-S-oxide reductase
MNEKPWKEIDMMRMMATIVLVAVLSVGLLGACRTRRSKNEDPSGQPANTGSEKETDEMTDKVNKTEEEWRRELTDQEFYVLREAGTEAAGTSDLLDNKSEGTYVCAGCGKELFVSDTKYKSGTGWPSFYAPIDEDAVATRPDRGLLGTRTEVLCPRCGGHLGHVFEDGPEPTGLRYCINGVALDFEPGEPEQGE